MKTKLITLLAVFTVTTGLISQVVNVTNTSAGFEGQMRDMYMSQNLLYTTKQQDSIYSEFVYATDYDPFFGFGEGTGIFITNAINPQNTTAEDMFSKLFLNVFQEMDQNLNGFVLDGTMSVGFFGNESWDKNKMILEAKNGSESQIVDPLIEYAKTGNTPATGLDITSVNGTSIVKFIHENKKTGAVADQSDPLKFKTFQKIDPFTMEPLNEYVMFIDDRMNSKIDHDDGFFYVTGDMTPVPEPALISIIALAGLATIVYFKRKK